MAKAFKSDVTMGSASVTSLVNTGSISSGLSSSITNKLTFNYVYSAGVPVLDMLSTSGDSFMRIGNGTVNLVSGMWTFNNSGFIGTSTAHQFALRTNNSDRMTIDSSGNTTFSGNVTASAASAIFGNAIFRTDGSGINVYSTSASEGGQINLYGGTLYSSSVVQIDNYAGDMRFLYSNGNALALTMSNTTGAFTINTSLTASAGTTRLGNTGIGGTPSYPIHVQSTLSPTIVAQSTASTAVVTISANDINYSSNFTGTSIRQYGPTSTASFGSIPLAGAGALLIQNSTYGVIGTNTNDLIFITTNTERMRIATGGAVTIAGATTISGALTASTVTSTFGPTVVANGSNSTTFNADGTLTGSGNSFAGVWLTTWTPVPSTTSGSVLPTFGTGSSAVGTYIKIGKTIIGQFTVAFGSSGTASGNGIVYVSLPVTAKTGNVPIGSGGFWDAGGVGQYTMQIFTESAKNLMIFRTQGYGNYTRWNGPFTASTNDVITGTFMYESA